MEAWVSVAAFVSIQRGQENFNICKTLKHANLWLLQVWNSCFPEDQPLSVGEMSSCKPTELCQTMPSTGDELILQQFCFRAPRSPVTFTFHTRVRAFGKITFRWPLWRAPLRAHANDELMFGVCSTTQSSRIKTLAS